MTLLNNGPQIYSQCTATTTRAIHECMVFQDFQDLLNISQVYKVNNMRYNYYNSYYIHALIKQRNKTNGSTQSCIFDSSSKHQTLDVPFTRRHMHTSDTDTHVYMHNRIAKYLNNQNQNSSKHMNLSCRWKHNNIYNNKHVTICQFMP